MNYLRSAATTTAIELPHFPHEERVELFARRAQQLQAKWDADDLEAQLVDPLQRTIDMEEAILGAAGFDFYGGTYPLRQVISQDEAELHTPAHIAAEGERKKLVLANDAKHLPFAWAATTTVGLRGSVIGPAGTRIPQYASTTTITARNEADFVKLVVRKSDAELRSALIQELFVVGTYAANNTEFAGKPAERAALEAHLNCFLGETGRQLLVDYARFAGPTSIFLHFVKTSFAFCLPLQLIPAAFGLRYAVAQDPATAAERGHQWWQSCLAVGVLTGVLVAGAAIYGGALAHTRRRAAAHIRGTQQVIEAHQTLQREGAPLRPDRVRQVLQETTAYVRKHSYPIAKQEANALQLRPISEEALDELHALYGSVATS